MKNIMIATQNLGVSTLLSYFMGVYKNVSGALRHLCNEN